MRSRVGFTQGLEFRDGVLYESTGNIGGTTQLNTITLDGKVTTLADHGSKVFGEGLTILNDEVFQFTWQERQVFVYDIAGKLKRQMRNPRDGWGLSHDGTNLLFTDGGPSLYYADPQDLQDRQVGDDPGRQGSGRGRQRARARRRQALRQHLHHPLDRAFRSARRAASMPSPISARCGK